MGDFRNARILKQNKQTLSCEFQGQLWREREEGELEPPLGLRPTWKSAQTPSPESQETVPGDLSP